MPVPPVALLLTPLIADWSTDTGSSTGRLATAPDVTITGTLPDAGTAGTVNATQSCPTLAGCASTPVASFPATLTRTPLTSLAPDEGKPPESPTGSVAPRPVANIWTASPGWDGADWLTVTI